VVEALPWVARCYSPEIDWNCFVRQVKLRDLQNRAGFVLELALALPNHGRPTPLSMRTAKEDLEKARLLNETTLCWDSMPEATRRWVRENRTAEARHWNVAARLRVEDLVHAQ